MRTRKPKIGRQYSSVPDSDFIEQESEPGLPRSANFNPKEVLSRYKHGIAISKDQRERERQALRFMVPEFQWSEQAKNARNGTNLGNGAAVPARPCLAISKIEQPIQLVQNQFQNAHLGINVHPLSEKANKETAEIFQGLIRKYERDSNANLQRGWAFDRGVEAGWGVYRIVTEYDDDSDNPSDQKILLKRILRQESVLFDPSAQEADYSDAEWAFITSYMPLDRFKREYPKAEISKATDGELAAIMRDKPDWVQYEGDEKAVLVSEYFCKHYTTETVTVEGSDYTRERKKVRLMWSKIAPGTTEEIQEIEPEVEWNGQYIPIIPVIGKEMQVFDKDRRYVGIVEPAMDSQRGFNYSITTATEVAALEPKAPVIGAEGQFEDHEVKWNQANVRNFSYLEYKPTTLGEHLLPPPQRMQIDASRLSVSMALMDKFDLAIQATTYTPDPALGKHSRDESGKAIMALQDQAQASTSNFLQNMAQISMTLEGKILLDMIPRIYDRPGRVTRILTLEGETEEVVLNAPFIVDPNTGRPVVVNEQQQMSPMTTSGAAPMPPSAATGPGQAPRPQPKTYNLAEGKYGVQVTIGKSYASRLEQGQSQLGELIQTDPTMAPLLMPILLKFADFPGAQEAAEVMKKIRAKLHPELEQAEEGQETPEQLRAMLEAEKAKNQRAEQIMQQMKQALDTDMAKQQADIEKAKIKAESDAQLTQMKGATEQQTSQVEAMLKAKLAEIDAMAKENLERILAENELARQDDEQAFKIALEAMKQKFEAEQAERDRQQADKMAVHQAEVARETAETANQQKEGAE